MFTKKDLMNIESLVMLYAVKKCSGKGQAARDLNTSIDTLNKYLENLERELGLKLISVNDRRCSLTVNGEKLVEVAEKIKACLQSAYAIAPMETAVRGEVKIAYDGSVRCNLCVQKLWQFFDKHPEISLLVDTFDKMPDMGDMNYDLGVGYQVPKGDDLVVLFSKELDCRFFASSEYLATHSYPKNLDDLLQNHRLILMRDFAKKGEWAKWLVSKSKKCICFSNSEFIAKDMVVNGGGIGIMPLGISKVGQGLVCLDNIKCDVPKTVYLVSHRSVKDLPRVRVVIEYYKYLLQRI